MPRGAFVIDPERKRPLPSIPDAYSIGPILNTDPQRKKPPMSKSNPRYANGNLRRKNRARMKARGDECGICQGRLGPIHYDEPSDYKHPLSFVIDEIKPISRYKQFGYGSKREAAEDPSNIQAAHYICNQKKRDRVGFSKILVAQPNSLDGNW